MNKYKTLSPIETNIENIRTMQFCILLVTNNINNVYSLNTFNSMFEAYCLICMLPKNLKIICDRLIELSDIISATERLPLFTTYLVKGELPFGEIEENYVKLYNEELGNYTYWSAEEVEKALFNEKFLLDSIEGCFNNKKMQAIFLALALNFSNVSPSHARDSSSRLENTASYSLSESKTTNPKKGNRSIKNKKINESQNRKRLIKQQEEKREIENVINLLKTFLWSRQNDSSASINSPEKDIENKVITNEIKVQERLQRLGIISEKINEQQRVQNLHTKLQKRSENNIKMILTLTAGQELYEKIQTKKVKKSKLNKVVNYIRISISTMIKKLMLIIGAISDFCVAVVRFLMKYSIYIFAIIGFSALMIQLYKLIELVFRLIFEVETIDMATEIKEVLQDPSFFDKAIKASHCQDSRLLEQTDVLLINKVLRMASGTLLLMRDHIGEILEYSQSIFDPRVTEYLCYAHGYFSSEGKPVTIDEQRELFSYVIGKLQEKVELYPPDISSDLMYLIRLLDKAIKITKIAKDSTDKAM